jgi:glycosyltransferase involved in cell wall biosynthesis
MQPSDVTIVIPALNEEAGIGDVVTSIRAELPEVELLVVDDGSTDDTARIATEAGARVIHHIQNRGYGASLRTGTLASTRDWVLFCDSDGQHTIEDVARIVAACDDCDMVVGARGKESHAPLLRRPGKFVLRNFANFLAGEKIPDLNSGLRIVKREVLLRYLHLMPQGFSFSTTSTFAILKTNRVIKWVPITVSKRLGVSTVRQWKHGPQTLMLILRLTVLFEPLKVFLSVSGLLMLLTLVMFTWDMIHSHGRSVGNATVALSMSSLIIFMFGLLCDQVSAIRRERNE